MDIDSLHYLCTSVFSPPSMASNFLYPQLVGLLSIRKTPTLKLDQLSLKEALLCKLGKSLDEILHPLLSGMNRLER